MDRNTVACRVMTYRQRSFLVQERCCSRGHLHFDVFEPEAYKRNGGINNRGEGIRREGILESESLSCENRGAAPGLECLLRSFDGLFEL